MPAEEGRGDRFAWRHSPIITQDKWGGGRVEHAKSKIEKGISVPRNHPENENDPRGRKGDKELPAPLNDLGLSSWGSRPPLLCV